MPHNVFRNAIPSAIRGASILVALLAAGGLEAQAMKIETTKLETELVAKYGEAERPRVARGLKQAAEFWRPEDGDAAAFDAFARANFAGRRRPGRRCLTGCRKRSSPWTAT